MAEAGSLSVSITGDASGLISSLHEAQTAIGMLNSSAGKSVNDFGGKEASFKITAVDNTAKGVASAKSALNSLSDKTVTVSVRYALSGIPKLAGGTKNAREGLGIINDERGVSDPRELVEHNGRLMMFSGRDVIVPLSDGDKVYTAEETKAIMSGMGIPHYARGKNNNEMFEVAKDDFRHYQKTNNMSPAEELQQWNELMRQFAYDSEAVKECQEEIFAAQQKIWAAQKKESASALSDYKKHSDAWIKYQTEVGGMGADAQIEAYKRQLDSYNAMVSEMVASTLYSADEIKEIWEDFYEYKADVDLKIGKLEKQKNDAVYTKWQSDAKNWKTIRDTYDDWYEAGDSPVKFYERSIERIQQMYDGGYAGWQEYSDDTMTAKLNLYKAKMDEVDELLSRQKAYISSTKVRFTNEEKALSDKWTAEDTAADKAETARLLKIYSGAVTERGIDKYKSLQEQMKKIQREEEMYALQKTHTETLAELEESFDIVEANKKYLLNTIEKTGISIEGIVGSVNYDIKSMEDTISSLFAQTISAIKSIRIASSSYSDNRKINISSNSSDIVNALKNRVGLSIAHSQYY